MLKHRKRYFGLANRHTVQMAKKLGKHIVHTTSTEKEGSYTYQRTLDNGGVRTMDKPQLLLWALDILNDAHSKCVSVKYRKKIQKEILVVQDKIQECQPSTGLVGQGIQGIQALTRAASAPTSGGKGQTNGYGAHPSQSNPPGFK